MNTYTVATLLNLKGTFKDTTGAPINPDIVKASVRAPDGTVTQFSSGEITNPSTGVFLIQFAPEQIGLYQYRFAGYDDPGAEPIAADEGNFLAQTEFLGAGAP